VLLQVKLQQLRKDSTAKNEETVLSFYTAMEKSSAAHLVNREDLYLNILRDYVKTLGGEIKLVASFPDAELEILPLALAIE
jgi:hypothetical protein